MSDPRRGERGLAAPLILVAVLFAAASCAGLARVGVAASHRAAAQAAADAVALAGATAGTDGAERVAAANEADVVRYAGDALEVEVTIERRGVRATARARWQPGAIP